MSEKDSAANQVVPALVHTLGTLALAAVTAIAIKWFFSRKTKEGETLDDDADWHLHLDLMAKDEQSQKDPAPALLKVSKRVEENGSACAGDGLSLKDSSTLHDKCMTQVDSLSTVCATNEHDKSIHEDLPHVRPSVSTCQCPLVTLGSNGRLALPQTSYADKMKSTKEQKMPFQRDDKPDSRLETVTQRKKEEYNCEMSAKCQGSITQYTDTGLETDFSEGLMQYHSANKSLYGDKMILGSGKHDNGKACTTKGIERYQSPVSNHKSKLLLVDYEPQHLGNIQANTRNILVGRKNIPHKSFLFAPRIERAIITHKVRPGNYLELPDMCFLRPSINDGQNSQVKTVTYYNITREHLKRSFLTIDSSPSSPPKTYPAIFCSTEKSKLYPSLLLSAQANHSWLSKYDKYKHTEYKRPKQLVQIRHEKSNHTEEKENALATTSHLNLIAGSVLVSQEALSEIDNNDIVMAERHQAFGMLCERDKKLPEIQKNFNYGQTKTQYLVHIPYPTLGINENNQIHECYHHGKKSQQHGVITESKPEEYSMFNATQVFNRLENNPENDENGQYIKDTLPIPEKDYHTLITHAKIIPSQSPSLLELNNSLSYEESIAFNPIYETNLSRDNEKSNVSKGNNTTEHDYIVPGTRMGSTIPYFATNSELTISSTDISPLNLNKNSTECCRFQQDTNDSADNTSNGYLHGSQEHSTNVNNQWQQYQGQDNGSSALQSTEFTLGTQTKDVYEEIHENTFTIDQSSTIITNQQVLLIENSKEAEAKTVGDWTMVGNMSEHKSLCSLMDPSELSNSHSAMDFAISEEQFEPMQGAHETEIYPTYDLPHELEHETQDASQHQQKTTPSSDPLLSSKSILSNIAENNNSLSPEPQKANIVDVDMPLVAKSCENIYSQLLRQRLTLKSKAQSMMCLLAEYYSSTGGSQTGPVEEVSRGSFIRIPAGLQDVGKAMRVQLTLGNCLELLKLARKNSVPELIKAVYTVISDNYLHVLKNPAIYGRLTASERDQILQLRMKGKASLCIIEMKSIFEWNKKKQDSAKVHQFQSRGQLYALDMEKNQWKMVTSIPEEACLKGSSICSMHNYLFIAGGIQVVGGNSTCSSKLFFYNPLTDIWGQLMPMNQARSQLKLIPLDGYLYAIGGECLHTVEKYDPRLNKWTFTAPLPKGSFAVAHEAVACGGDIFISGGHLFYRLLKYSPVNDQWEECPFGASKGRSCDMIAVGNILYRFDIQRDSTVGIFKYNTISKSWSEYTAIFPGSKMPFRCAVIDGAIYCLNRETTTRFAVEDEAVMFESAVFSSFPTKGLGSACPVVLNLTGSVPQTSV